MAETAVTSDTNLKTVRVNKRSNPINISPTALWEIVGTNFDKAGFWASSLNHSEGKGDAQLDGAPCDERACDVNAAGFSKIKEKVVGFDEKNRILSYDVIEGFPGWVVHGNNTWTIHDLGNGQSAVEMQVTMKMKKFMGFLMGGMMTKNLNKALDEVIEDLIVYAETGEVSERKKKLNTKLAKKAA